MSINSTAVWPGLLSTSTTISAWQSQKKLGTEADPRFLIATENQIGIFVVENWNFTTGKSRQQQNMPIEHAVFFLHMRGVGKILRQLTQTVQSVIFAAYLCWCWGPYWHDPSLVMALLRIKKYLLSDNVVLLFTFICCWYRFLSYIQVLVWLSNANFKFPMLSFSWLHRLIKDCLILYR